MPCMTSDGMTDTVSTSDHRRLEERLAKLERERGADVLASRALCGICQALATIDSLDVVLKHVNWRTAGVTREEFERWWREHQNADARGAAK